MKKYLIVFWVMVFTLVLYCPSGNANPVKDLFEKGVAAYEHGQYEKSIELFETAIKIYPNLAPAYNYIGLCQKSLNADVSTVISSFEKSIETDPNYILAYDNLAKIYYGLNDYEKAEKYNLKTIELNPKMLSSYLSLGWINLIGKSDPEEAIYYFKKVAEQTDMPYANFGLGLAYFLGNDHVEVLNMITVLRKAGKESLARHLEQMLRENRYIAPNGPGISGPPQGSTKTSSSKTTRPPRENSPEDDLKEMKVRLRKR